MIRKLFRLESVYFKGKVYSPEHQTHFETEGSEAKIENNPKEKGTLRLSLDGLEEREWLKQKSQNITQKIGSNAGNVHKYKELRM